MIHRGNTKRYSANSSLKPDNWFCWPLYSSI